MDRVLIRTCSKRTEKSTIVWSNVRSGHRYRVVVRTLKSSEVKGQSRSRTFYKYRVSLHVKVLPKVQDVWSRIFFSPISHFQSVTLPLVDFSILDSTTIKTSFSFKNFWSVWRYVTIHNKFVVYETTGYSTVPRVRGHNLVIFPTTESLRFFFFFSWLNK